MAKVIDIQQGTVVSDISGQVNIKFDPPFSEGYVLEIYHHDHPILIRVMERDNLHWKGEIWHGDDSYSFPSSGHNHAITLSACAAGHADCVASSPSGGPSAYEPRKTNVQPFEETYSWIAIGV